MKTVFAQETQEAARTQWRNVADNLRERFVSVAELMDSSEEDVLAYMAFPKEHWTQIHPANPLERLNKEIKRRTNFVGIFPNGKGVKRSIRWIEQCRQTRRQFGWGPAARLAPVSDSKSLVEASAEGMILTVCLGGESFLSAGRKLSSG